MTDLQDAPTMDDRPSLGKVYDAINDLKQDVAVIKSDMPTFKDHEDRLRALERLAWSLAGTATLAGAGLSFVLQKLFE